MNLLPKLLTFLALIVCLSAEEVRLSKALDDLKLTKLKERLTEKEIDKLEKLDAVTILAPSDDAFTTREGRTSEVNLEEVKFHVIPKKIMKNDIKDNLKETSYDESNKLRFNIRDTKENNEDIKMYTVQQGKITNPDNKIDNGVIHIVDTVLEPYPSSNFMKTMADTKTDDLTKSLNELHGAINVAKDVKNKIDKGDKAYTIFAPNDEAMKNVSGGGLEAYEIEGITKMTELVKDEKELAKVLNRHIVKGTLFMPFLSDTEETLETEQGQKITVKRGGDDGTQILIDGQVVATVLKDSENIATANGVIHVIDHLLIPSTEKDSATRLKILSATMFLPAVLLYTLVF